MCVKQIRLRRRNAEDDIVLVRNKWNCITVGGPRLLCGLVGLPSIP
jgi:hypothetical protein